MLSWSDEPAPGLSGTRSRFDTGADAVTLPAHATKLVCALPSFVEATATAASLRPRPGAGAPFGLVVASVDGEVKVWAPQPPAEIDGAPALGATAGRATLTAAGAAAAVGAPGAGQFALRGYMNVSRAGRKMSCARVLSSTAIVFGFSGGVFEIWGIPHGASTIATMKSPLHSVKLLTTAAVTSVAVAFPGPSPKGLSLIHI